MGACAARHLTPGCCLRGLRPLRSIRRMREGAGEVLVVSKEIELVSRLNAGSAAFVRYVQWPPGLVN